MHSMIEFSKKKTTYPEFIKNVQELLSNELYFPESLFIFSVDDYFLKSSYKHIPEQYWNIRTNELDESDKFQRLARITESEIDFGFDICLSNKNLLYRSRSFR